MQWRLESTSRREEGGRGRRGGREYTHGIHPRDFLFSFLAAAEPQRRGMEFVCVTVVLWWYQKPDNFFPLFSDSSDRTYSLFLKLEQRWEEEAWLDK